MDSHVITAEEYQEIPELTDDFFLRAKEHAGGKPVGRGQNKISTTVCFDREIIAAFRASGKGWQTRMNSALREWLASHPSA